MSELCGTTLRMPQHVDTSGIAVSRNRNLDTLNTFLGDLEEDETKEDRLERNLLFMLKVADISMRECIDSMDAFISTYMRDSETFTPMSLDMHNAAVAEFTTINATHNAIIDILDSVGNELNDCPAAVELYESLVAEVKKYIFRMWIWGRDLKYIESRRKIAMSRL